MQVVFVRGKVFEQVGSELLWLKLQDGINTWQRARDRHRILGCKGLTIAPKPRASTTCFHERLARRLQALVRLRRQ